MKYLERTITFIHFVQSNRKSNNMQIEKTQEGKEVRNMPLCSLRQHDDEAQDYFESVLEYLQYIVIFQKTINHNFCMRCNT